MKKYKIMNKSVSFLSSHFFFPSLFFAGLNCKKYTQAQTLEVELNARENDTHKQKPVLASKATQLSTQLP
jgi:hypothetical protein